MSDPVQPDFSPESRARLRRVWHGIRNRCFNPNNPRFATHGGRGIWMHPAWLNDFRAFRVWALANGFKPGLAINRIHHFERPAGDGEIVLVADRDLDEIPALGFVLQRLGDRLAIRDTAGNRLTDSIMATLQGVLDIVGERNDFRKRWRRHQKDAVVVQLKSDLIPHQLR